MCDALLCFELQKKFAFSTKPGFLCEYLSKPPNTTRKLPKYAPSVLPYALHTVKLQLSCYNDYLLKNTMKDVKNQENGKV